jgi:hypothetical protein
MLHAGTVMLVGSESHRPDNEIGLIVDDRCKNSPNQYRSNLALMINDPANLSLWYQMLNY